MSSPFYTPNVSQLKKSALIGENFLCLHLTHVYQRESKKYKDRVGTLQKERTKAIFLIEIEEQKWMKETTKKGENQVKRRHAIYIFPLVTE